MKMEESESVLACMICAKWGGCASVAEEASNFGTDDEFIEEIKKLRRKCGCE